MPHQLPVGAVVSTGPRSLLERPQLAALIGTVAAEWAFLEDSLTRLYAVLMGIYLPKTPGLDMYPSVHPVALQVFDTLETMRPRLQLLGNLAGWVVKNKAELERLKKEIVPAIEKAGRVRNRVVHAMWGLCGDYPDALVLQPTFGHSVVYYEKDFDAVIDEVIGARALVWNFESTFRKPGGHHMASTTSRDEEFG